MNPRITLGALVVLALVLVGCSATAAGSPSPTPVPSVAPSTQSPEPTEEHTPKPTVAPSTPAATQQPTPAAPSPTPTPLGKDVKPMTTIRVLVNGLAVRTGPSTDLPLLSAYRYPDRFVTDQLRVDAGHYLVVEHGPLVVNGIPWLKVANLQQPGESPEDTLRWDIGDDDLHFDAGWIAGAGADGSGWVAQAEVPRDPDAPTYGPGPDPLVAVAGVGSMTIDSVDLELPIFDWVAADASGADCTMTITLEPSGERIAEEAIHGLDGAELFLQDAPESADIVIDTDCSWSLTVMVAQG